MGSTSRHSSIKRKTAERTGNQTQRRKSDSFSLQHRKPKGKLTANSQIRSAEHTYVIKEVLGTGGFGEVYKVYVENETGNKKIYAMKTEFLESDKGRPPDRLKVEMSVFTDTAIAAPNRRIHFCEMADKGVAEATPKFKFIVMSLVGPSLENIRRSILGGDFTQSTVCQIALQTLQAIEDLHALGYLHRDIKPHNYAVGIPPKDNVVFMLDFGICRKFVDKDGMLKVPREKVKFLGTVKFASRNCHKGREQGRADDLEQWIFMIYDVSSLSLSSTPTQLFNHNNLPWRQQRDRHKVGRMKEDFFNKEKVHSFVYNSVPGDFTRILIYIAGLAYSDQPDYYFIKKVIKQACEVKKIDLSEPLDWANALENKDNETKAPSISKKMKVSTRRKAKKEINKERTKELADEEEEEKEKGNENKKEGSEIGTRKGAASENENEDSKTPDG